MPILRAKSHRHYNALRRLGDRQGAQTWIVSAGCAVQKNPRKYRAQKPGSKSEPRKTSLHRWRERDAINAAPSAGKGRRDVRGSVGGTFHLSVVAMVSSVQGRGRIRKD